MRTFKVKNFERFQHYRDRSPPWIKLYNELLDDYEFGKLPDAAKWHVVASWLLASRYSNQIPHDAEWVTARINARTKVDLELLERAGFIIPDNVLNGASSPLASCKQSAIPEREGESERETEEEREGEVSARAKRAPTANRLPDDFDVSPEMLAWAAENEPGVDATRETAAFRDYWKAASGAKARKHDWKAGWRGWIRKAGNDARGKFNGHGPPRQTREQLREEIKRRLAGERP